MGRTETYRVYTPACYRQQTNRRYPVIYLLHGGEHNEEHWDNVGIDEAADTLIAKGTIPHQFQIFPGRHIESYWNSHLTDYLRFYTQEWQT